MKPAPTLAVIAVALSLAAPAAAQTQQSYPVRPVRLVVAFSAGGTPDTLARMIAPKLSERWK